MPRPGKTFPYRTLCFAAVAASVGLLFALSSLPRGTASPAAPDQAGSGLKTLGFAVTSLPFALAKNEDDCPDGMALTAKEIYLASISPAEHARLSMPENLKEFEQKAFHTPDGKDFCQAADYPRAQQRTTHSKISYGMNLDGTTDGHATDTTCAHEKFTGPDGGPEIDNQSYRVLACSSNYRGFRGEEGYLESLRMSALGMAARPS